MEILFHWWNNLAMDLNEILIFTRVVETQSFTRAARVLGLPKSTVSRKISHLEERLGVRLLQRTTRQLKLTDIGTSYYQRCATIVAEVEEAEQLVTEMQTVPRGKVRVTAPVEFGAAFLGEFVAKFLAEHPEMTVDIVLTDRVVDVVEEGFDLAIRVGPLVESTLIARKLGSMQRLLCASPSYLDQCGVPQSPDELEGHACIVFSASPGGRVWRLLGPTGSSSLTVSGRLAANNFNLIRDATVAGLGVAMLPAFLCADAIAEGHLVPILERWLPAEDHLFAVYASTRHVAAKVRAFLDHLTRELSRPPWQVSLQAQEERRQATRRGGSKPRPVV